MSTIEARIKKAVRDVPDFPKKGIMFKDITPILFDQQLCMDIVKQVADNLQEKPTKVAAIESRGFLFGIMLANYINVPFIPIRKAGKLPYQTISHTYELEYGTATIEMHIDAVEKGDLVLIHDDLLATGGTAAAAAHLIEQCNGKVTGFSFIIDLSFLNGSKILKKYSNNIDCLATY